jgi:hypothetical protein
MPSDELYVTFTRRSLKMKKLMVAMLSLSLLTGLAAVSFGQDKKDDSKMEKKKKGKKKKEEKKD